MKEGNRYEESSIAGWPVWYNIIGFSDSQGLALGVQQQLYKMNFLCSHN